MEFGKADWKSFEQGIRKEWLLTNGIGGFASSTIIGANSRRYHGLLVAALNPPVSRHLILSKIDESIIVNHCTHNLYASRTPDTVISGHHFLQRVVIEHIPTSLYSVEDIFIEKKITLIYGENTVAVVYRIMNGSNPMKLRLAPLVNFRDYHGDSSRQYMFFQQMPLDGGICVKPYNMETDIWLCCKEADFIPQKDCYFMNMDYPMERERGLQSVEDHYIPGYFEVDVAPGEEKTVTVLATIEKKLPEQDGPGLIRWEEERIAKLTEAWERKDKLACHLVTAADAFIVYRKSTDSKTIIAGYPWFTDWGRDTMIALPGLTLVTGRYNDARDILYTFSKYVKDGLIPNMFPDAGDEPPYNSVDASLWYFEAVYKYLQYTGNYDFIREKIYSVLIEILHAYRTGTRFNIRMEEDFLISAGDMGTQLTWMDAKVGDWVVTPRHGKAVEINALWYNALRIMTHLATHFGKDESLYAHLAQKMKDSFEKTFWNGQKQCLYDVVTGEYKDDRVRPNQIIALSLSHPVLEGGKAKQVVQKVWSELYTAYGLRSLSPFSEEYRGIYEGDQYSRDGAYHQGTVWTWPLGHFITAYRKVNGYSTQSAEMARKFIRPFADHLRDACVGSISEIFDGNEPLLPRGCFAQAWSVAEVLRAYVEDVLQESRQ